MSRSIHYEGVARLINNRHRAEERLCEAPPYAIAEKIDRLSARSGPGMVIKAKAAEGDKGGLSATGLLGAYGLLS